jgi:hypothetical protein
MVIAVKESGAQFFGFPIEEASRLRIGGKGKRQSINQTRTASKEKIEYTNRPH